MLAIEAGKLDPRRLDSWRKLLRSELRQDARLRAAQLTLWKQLTAGHRPLGTRRRR